MNIKPLRGLWQPKSSGQALQPTATDSQRPASTIEGKLLRFGFVATELEQIIEKLSQAVKPYNIPIAGILNYLDRNKMGEKAYVLHYVASEPFRNCIAKSYKVQNG